MRLFQNGNVYSSYRPRLARLTRGCSNFGAAMAAFLDDRYNSLHFLKPVLSRDPNAFVANGDYAGTQRLWARENGIRSSATLADILLAQIEAHRTEVFYNLDPMTYGDEFIPRLPGCVRRTIAWRAAPSKGKRFLQYDLVVNNFPAILAALRADGAKTAYFFPAHDPFMDQYAARQDRDIDLLFVGTYSRHHKKRQAMLEAMAALNGTINVAIHLERSKLTRLSETPLGWVGPLRSHRRPAEIRRLAREPLFGRDLLDVISRAKIVVNGAIDMSGIERGNVRVWETLGCGAALLSDDGKYPEHMHAGIHFATYSSVQEVVEKARLLVQNDVERIAIAKAGHAMIADEYSKEKQWDAFERLAS